MILTDDTSNTVTAAAAAAAADDDADESINSRPHVMSHHLIHSRLLLIY